MTAQTEKITIGDVVKWETNGSFCRDSKKVAASQTLVVGEVVSENGSSEIVTAKNTLDEVQTMAMTGTLTAGSYTLTFVDPVTLARKTTSLIAYNASVANIQTAIDAALGASQVIAGGTAQTATTFTFSGGVYADNQNETIDVDATDIAGLEDTTVTRTTKSAEEKIDGIMLEAFTTASGETPEKSVLVRGPAIVDENSLTYGTTPLAEVRARLLALGIVTRTSV